MNPTDTITTLFSHHLWANQQILEVCAGLSDEQLDATVIGTFGTIRDTLQHIVTAERSYFSRISTGKQFRRPENEPPLTLVELQESLRRTGQGLIEWAPKIQADETVEVNWEDEGPRQIGKTIILTQAINHATEHRAQIMAILTQLGIQPPDLDGWSYYIAQEK